ncbi:hypothetical protein B4U84_29130 [Westiellopsis prolifica IICB1]|nr:hypothetical protein B4U84_29130 [Westiellopsis prolifica IICB1]
MGEAKRRKMLDPNYGKVSNKKNNVQNDISPLVNALINFSRSQTFPERAIAADFCKIGYFLLSYL